MHQRDFIMRIIEQLGVALVELRRGILQQEDPVATRETLARTASQAGFDIELLRGFDLNTLQLFVAATGEVDLTRCWLTAEILYLDGLDRQLSEGDGENSLLKARALYDLVRPAGGMLVGMPEAAERIAEIDQLLGVSSDPDQRPGSARPRRLKARKRAARDSAPGLS
jgi:hypothetical protein